jgi:hypothetical protein
MNIEMLIALAVFLGFSPALGLGQTTVADLARAKRIP